MKKKLSFRKMLDITETKGKPPPVKKDPVAPKVTPSSKSKAVEKPRKKQKARKAVKKKKEILQKKELLPSSQKDKKERVRAPEKSKQEKKPDQKKIVLFRLANEYYGIDVSKIDEIIDAHINEKIAGMPDFVAGVIALRGESIPVLSLNHRFHLKENTPADTHTVLITSRNGEVFGICIDELQGVVDIETSSILGVPSIFPEEEMAYLKGIITHGAKIAALIDIELVLKKYKLG